MPQSKIQQKSDDVLMASISGEQRWVPLVEVESFIDQGMKKVVPDPTGEEPPHWSDRAWDAMRSGAGVVADVATGAGKSAARSVLGAGAFLRENVPGVQAVHDAAGGDWATVDMETLEPTNRAQELGGVAEQVGEFFIPIGGPVSKVAQKYAPGLMRHLPFLRRTVDSAGAGALTLAQGGSVPEAIASSALQGVFPSARGLAGTLEDSAQRSVAGALRPTTNQAKNEAARLAPEMIERGVRGSQSGMLREAQRKVGEIGPRIGAEVAEQSQRGTTVKTAQFLEDMKAARLKSQGGVGDLVGTIPGTNPILAKLDELEAYAAAQGDFIPIRHAQAIKQMWGQIVSKAGLYAEHADSAPTDRAAAWVYREGAASMRKLIGEQSPTLKKLNTEFSFWQGLNDVLSATALRTQGQRTAMTQTLMAASGGTMVGAATGSTLKGIMGMAAMSTLTRLLQSSAFRTRVSAPLKMKLADALSAGDKASTLQAITNIAASVPSIRAELFDPNLAHAY